MSITKYEEEIEKALLDVFLAAFLQRGYEFEASGDDTSEDLLLTKDRALLHDYVFNQGGRVTVLFRKPGAPEAECWLDVQPGNGVDVIIDFSTNMPPEIIKAYQDLNDQIGSVGLIEIMRQRDAQALEMVREGFAHARTALLMRTAVGTAELGDVTYELSAGMNSAPMIKNTKTGRTWAMKWETLIDIARFNGIDEEQP